MNFGNLPNTYSTLLASDGARHGVSGNNPLALFDNTLDKDGNRRRPGVAVATRTDAQPNSTATSPANDKQGVLFGTYDQYDRVVESQWIPGQKATVTVTVTGGVDCYLNAFADWNGNNQFDTNPSKLAPYISTEYERFERLIELTPQQVAAGIKLDPTKGLLLPKELSGQSIELTFTVPRDAKPGTIGSRFRISTAGGLNFYGYARDGEVEDYMVQIHSVSQDPIRLEGKEIMITGSVLRDDLLIYHGNHPDTGKYGDQIVIQLNGGIPRAYDKDQVEKITFDGIYGWDTVTVYGSAENAYVATMTPYSTNPDELGVAIRLDVDGELKDFIRLINAPSVTFDGAFGGGEANPRTGVEMFDTKGSDTLVMRPHEAQMTGVGYSHTVLNVTNILAHSEFGYDTVIMYGSMDDGDEFRMEGTTAKLLGADQTFRNTASRFADVQVFNLGGMANKASIDVGEGNKNAVSFERGAQNILDVHVSYAGDTTKRIRVFDFDSHIVTANPNSTVVSTARVVGSAQDEYLYGTRENNGNHHVELFASESAMVAGEDAILELLAFNATNSVLHQNAGRAHGELLASLTEEWDDWIGK